MLYETCRAGASIFLGGHAVRVRCYFRILLRNIRIHGLAELTSIFRFEYPKTTGICIYSSQQEV